MKGGRSSGVNVPRLLQTPGPRWPAGVPLLATGTALLALGLFSQTGMVTVVALVLAVAAGLTRWTRWDYAVPSAVLALVLLAALSGVAAHHAGLTGLGTRVGALAWVLVVWGGALVLVCWPGPGRTRPRLARGELLGWAPAAAAAVVAVINSTMTSTVLGWIADATDGAQHAWFIKQLRDTGAIDYASNGYPRGLHMLVALGADAAGTPATAEQYLQLAGALTTWSLVLLLWCVPLTVRVLTRDRWAPVCTAVVLGLLLIHPAFTGQLVYLAASTSLAAGAFALVAVTVAADWRPERTTRHLTLLGLITAVEIQLWTPVAAIPVGLGLFVLVRSALARDHRALPGRRDLVLLMTAVVVVLAPTGAALSGLMSRGGVSVAATAGSALAPDLLTLAMVLPGGLVLAGARFRTRAEAVMIAGILAAGLGYLVVLLGTGDPTNLNQWYPIKMAWLTFAVALPAGIAGWCAVMRWILPRAREGWRRAGRRSVVVPVVILAVPAALLVAFSPRLPVTPATPIALVHVNRSPGAEPGDLPASLRLVALAREHLDRRDGRVVVPVVVQPHLESTKESWLVSRIMSLETGQEPNLGLVRMACQDVRTVAGDPDRAVVITSLPQSYLQDVLHRQGCDGVDVEQTSDPMAWQGFATLLDDYGTLPPLDEATS